MNTINNFTPQTYQNNNIQFKGLMNQKNIYLPKFIKKEQFLDRTKEIAEILNKKPEEIINITKNASLNKLQFVDILTDRFSEHNFTKKTSPENVNHNANIIMEIFKSVKYPNDNHLYIAANVKGPFENLKRIFNAANNDSEKLKFVKKINKQVLDFSGYDNIKRPEIIPELLESKNANEYVKNFDTYKSYLTLNKNDENAVHNLDEMVNQKTFNPEKYNIELDVKKLFMSKDIHQTDKFNKEIIKQNYNKEGLDFLDKFFECYHPSKESLMNGNDVNIINMFKTTNKSNIDIRKKIMNKFQYNQFNNFNVKEKNENITNLNILFNKIDEDIYARKFVEKSMKKTKFIVKDIDIKNIYEYNQILDAVPPKKLNFFYQNAENIINQTEGKERIKALKENIENPFFMTERVKEIHDYRIEEGFEKKPSIFSKARKIVKNKINQLKEKIAPDSKKPIAHNEVKELDKVESKPVINIIEPIELPKADEVKPVINIDFKATDNAKPEEVVNIIKPLEIPKTDEVKIVIKAEPKDFITEVKNNAIDKGFVKEQVESTNKIDKSVKLAKTTPKLPNAKKLLVINDVNGIIEKKLGTKTLGEQKSDYAKKATKMRLNMLPEIFASIKETRATDKATGKKINYSNKDALALYEKINGKNKKLINYMLKKRNADGTRQFNIKDIITTLDDAEKQVSYNKKVAPKKYDAKSERNYYNNIFDTNVAIYGQLEKAKKQTIKQK